MRNRLHPKRMDRSQPGYTLPKLWLLFACMLMLTSPVAFGESNLSARFHSRYFENMADQLYETREFPKNLGLAIAYYKKAISAEPERPGIHWKVTRCYWVMAIKRSVNDSERLQYLKEGIRFGKTAIETDAGNSYAFSWYALVHGENALIKGVMNTIYMRTQILAWLEKAIKLDPENVNALLGLAAWYYHIPDLFGGNKIRSFSLLEKAARIDPNYTAIYLHKAQYLMGEKKYTEAVTVLKQLLLIKSPTLRNDGAEDKAKSLKLLEQLKNEGHAI